jgi:hypothetical protein
MERSEFKYQFCFESYGVPVRIESNAEDILMRAEVTARSALLGRIRPIDCHIAEQTFSLPLSPDGICSIVQNGKPMVTFEPEPRFWKFFDSLVRILVAEFAKEVVFLHAGVVAWRGKAIILPGNSFYGKTTLVAELIRCGAEYYSDEYAVLDADGRVHPFDRPLSMRSNGETVIEIVTPVERLNGSAGTLPVPVGCVLFTKYDPESKPNYEFLSTGQGVVEIIAQTIAIKRNTEFAINVLKKTLSNAIIVKSPRRDAGSFARNLLEFVDNTTI